MKYQLALIDENGTTLLGQDFNTKLDLAVRFEDQFFNIGQFCENYLNLKFCDECLTYNDGKCECEKTR